MKTFRKYSKITIITILKTLMNCILKATFFVCKTSSSLSSLTMLELYLRFCVALEQVDGEPKVRKFHYL